VLVGFLVGGGAWPSAAQVAAGSEQQAAQAPGPLVFERVRSGFVVGPDFRITDIDDATGQIIGGYGGWLAEGMFLVGGGAYWLAAGSDVDMFYGGAVVGWIMPSDRPISFGTRALIGAGEATLKTDVMFRAPDYPGRPMPAARFGRTGGDDWSSSVHRVELDQGFFVFEPQVDVFVRFAGWARLSCGVGYRVIGGANGFEDRLRGVTGSVALHFGGGK
jgi:hypothetical protein